MALTPAQRRVRRMMRYQYAVAALNATTDDYAVGGNSPPVVADFVNEYYRVGGSASDFSTMFDLGTTTAYPTSLRTMVDSDGALKWGPHNLVTQFSNWGGLHTDNQSDPVGGTNASRIDSSLCPSNTTFTATAGANLRHGLYVKAGTADTIAIALERIGNGVYSYNTWTFSTETLTTDATWSGNGSFTDIGGGWYFLEFDQIITTTSVNYNALIRSDGSGGSDSGTVFVYGYHVFRNDLGGMVDVPTDQRAASGAAFATYVPTTTAARYLHRRGNYVYDGSSWVKKGILIETEARTNLLLNSNTLSTQNVTTSATPYTLSFSGTGTVTLSGTSTAGPLVGTGTGENNRVNLTFTPTAGTLTLTVSGTVTNAQLEAGQTPSSYIPTAGSAVTRSADSLVIAAANMSASTSAMSLQLDGTITYADEGAAAQQTFLRWQTDASNYISLDLDTDGAATGEVNANQAVGGTVDTVVAGTEYTPGVNVAFNIASRHTSAAINVAKDGTAATADTTPASLVDLSARNCELFQDAIGNVSQFRQWDVDLGDAGIEAASS